MVILKDIIEFNNPLGEPPYCYRSVFNFGLFSIRIHRWIGPDKHLHTHPYWMLIFCIWGGYIDKSTIRDKVIAPTCRLRKPSHKHQVLTRNCVTLLITGPKLYKWYLWKNGKKMSPTRYFGGYNKQ